MNLQIIPKELKTRRQWVCHRPDKTPVNPVTGGNAQADNPATWGPYDQAVSHYQAHKDNGIVGIGFEFSPQDPYTGLDLDKCRDLETGVIEPWAREIIDRLRSYTEISPSGRGVHILVKGELPTGARRKGQIEMYDRARYFTMTGHHLEGTPATIQDRQAELEALHTEIFGKPQAPQTGQAATSRAVLSLALGDQELITLARQAANGRKFEALYDRGDWSGYPSQSEATAALLSHLVFYCGRDHARVDRLFRISGLMRDKWDRPQSGSTWGALEIQKAIARATEFYIPRQRPATPATRPTGCQKQAAEKAKNRTAPVFPPDVMTGPAGRFAGIYSKYLESPPEFLYLGYLTFLGHLLSDRLTLDAEIAPQGRLFIVILGESADTRKSTAINKVADFFYETINRDDLNAIYGVGSAEGLAKGFKKNKRAILILDELKSIIQKMKIDGSVLLPCINTLFESKRFHSLTKSHDITIDNAELCLLAASTLETYYNMFNSTFLDIGFINRLFIVIGSSERKYSIPVTIPESEKIPLKEDLREILDFISLLKQDGCYKLPIDAEARALFHQWYMGCESSLFSKRLDTYGHRLMVLLAANAKSERVTSQIVKDVILLLNYQLEARRFADPVDADTLAAKLEEKIRRTLAGGPVGKRELERRCHKGRVGCAVWDHSVKNMRSSGEIIYDAKGKIYDLSPLLSPD